MTYDKHGTGGIPCFVMPTDGLPARQPVTHGAVTASALPSVPVPLQQAPSCAGAARGRAAGASARVQMEAVVRRPTTPPARAARGSTHTQRWPAQATSPPAAGRRDSRGDGSAEPGPAAAPASSLHLLSDDDLAALLRWGGLCTDGARLARLSLLTAALAQHRAATAAASGLLLATLAATAAWLVDPLSTWRFPLSDARLSPGVPVCLGRASSGATPARPGGAGAPDCQLPSCTKAIARRHVEIVYRATLPSEAAARPHASGIPAPTGTACFPGMLLRDCLCLQADGAVDGAFFVRGLHHKNAVLHNGSKLLAAGSPGTTSQGLSVPDHHGRWMELVDGDRIIGEYSSRVILTTT